ncbi:MAG: type II CAAX endopeptidase family protein [Chloroflexi bacterium]|nr:type II CAAX endopeptidase family protein [Chloroflexota bacterium]
MQQEDTANPRRPMQKVGDILIVFAPILILGISGTAIGLETALGAALVNLGYVAGILAGGWVLNRRGSNWREIGLRRPDNWLRTILQGVGAFVAAIVVIIVTELIVTNIPGLRLPAPDVTRFDALESNLPFLIIGLIGAWTTIAFGEELFYRAFLVTRIQQIFARSSLANWLAIIFAGAIFGVAHFAEGPVGIATNGAFGILFGWIYLRSKQNLWITLIAHGLLNTIRFVLVYSGLTG